MRKYVTSENSGEHISVGFGSEFGTIDIFKILNEVRESETPQLFGIKKGGSISSDIIFKKGRLYFSCCDGNFYCIDGETGKELWRFSTGDVLPAFEMDEDTIYASCFDHNLYAITLGGELKWKFATNGKLGNNPCPYNNKYVYFGSEDGNFYCVNKKGNLVWRFATDSPIPAIPVIHEGIVFFGNFDGNFYALNAETGELVWRFTCKSPTGGCDIHKDIILVPSINKILYALSLDGKIIWTYKSKDKFTSNIKTDLYRNKVFIGSLGKCMTAIDIRTGKLVWEFPTGEMTNSFSKVRGGVLYFGGFDNNFYTVDAETGKEIWHFTANGPNVGSVEVYGDKVCFGSWDCSVYCLDTKTGRLIWKFHTSMGNMSDYEVDRRADKPELSIIVQPPEEVKKEAEKKEERLADYGEFSGSYIDKEKADYVKSGRKGYIKKKDF